MSGRLRVDHATRLGAGRPRQREIRRPRRPAAFGEEPQRLSDLRVEMCSPAPCRPPRASRAARSFAISRGTCGMRAAGVPGRGEKGKTCRCVSPHSSTSASVRCEHLFRLGRKAGDEIGAEHDIGPRRAQRGAEMDGVGARMAPLHALENQIVARLQ